MLSNAIYCHVTLCHVSALHFIKYYVAYTVISYYAESRSHYVILCYIILDNNSPKSLFKISHDIAYYNVGCALISIPGRAFPVTTYFLEDALEHTSYKVRDRKIIL